MSILWKQIYLTKPGVGEVIAYRKRWLARIFSGYAVKFAFRPALTGAGWYTIQRPADPRTLFECENAFSAMAYLRKCDPDLTPISYEDLY